MRPYGSKRSFDTEPRIKSARALVKREGEEEIEEEQRNEMNTKARLDENRTATPKTTLLGVYDANRRIVAHNTLEYRLVSNRECLEAYAVDRSLSEARVAPTWKKYLDVLDHSLSFWLAR